MLGLNKTFVVGSGRSGTLTAATVLGFYAKATHERKCTEVERLGTLSYYGLVDKETVVQYLRHTFSDGDVHVHNKLSWLMPELVRAFPKAKYVWLVRDGRKVVASYASKLKNEAYIERGVSAQKDMLYSGSREPSLDKGSWYPLPHGFRSDKFSYRDKLELLSWYWGYANYLVMNSDVEKHMVKLESLVSDRSVLNGVVEYACGVCAGKRAYDFVKRPHNIVTREKPQFNMAAENVFYSVLIAKRMMGELGYERSNRYEVEY